MRIGRFPVVVLFLTIAVASGALTPAVGAAQSDQTAMLERLNDLADNSELAPVKIEAAAALKKWDTFAK